MLNYYVDRKHGSGFQSMLNGLRNATGDALTTAVVSQCSYDFKLMQFA